MTESLDIVQTTFRIADNECPYVTLKLSQAYNKHHEFVVKVDYAVLGGAWMSNPKALIALVGERTVIEMKHTLKGTHNLFVGLITDVTMTGTDGVNTHVILTGKSESVRLDGKRAMNSYMDTTLENVVRQAVTSIGAGISLDISPRHDFIIDYLCQYNETDFEFLNRLSWIYGEDLYYTGTTLKFGCNRPNGDDLVTLTYDVNLIDLQLSVHLVPARFNRYAYLAHQDNEVDAIPQDSVKGLRGYLSDSLRRSDGIYTAEGDLPSEVPVNSLSELSKLVNIERGRAVAEMLTLKGSSRTCEVKLGGEVLVKMPESAPIGMKEVDEFLITSIEHEVDELGRYHNTFTGILTKLPAVPMTPIVPPHTGVQQGTVYSNMDPEGKGRVKVQLQWQKGLGKMTNWIRVQTPDAGSSGKVSSNRGFVCIPEEGDTVVVGFDFGDPNRPFVMGSLFSEATGAGGGEGNKGKSITTRSGHILGFDDSENGLGITLNDCGGNIIHLDAKGRNIEITAAETINITAKQINLNAKDIGLNASNSLKLSSMPDNQGGEGEIDIKAHKTMNLVTETDSLSISATGRDISLKANTELSAISETSSASVQAATDVAIEGADILVTGGSTVRISSADTDIV